MKKSQNKPTKKQEEMTEAEEDAILVKLGEAAYREFLESGEEGTPYDEFRKKLGLDKDDPK